MTMGVAALVLVLGGTAKEADGVWRLIRDKSPMYWPSNEIDAVREALRQVRDTPEQEVAQPTG